MMSETGLFWTRCFLCSSPVVGHQAGHYEVGGVGEHQSIDDGVKLVMKYLLHDFKLEEPLATSVIAQWGSGGSAGVGEEKEADGGAGAPGGEDFTPRLCTYCRNLVGSISKLQLELEMIQMRMVSGLEDLKKAVISNSRLYGGNDGVKQDFEELEDKLLQIETHGGDCTSGRNFLDVIHHFQTFVFENDSKHQHIPLVYLEKFTGSQINLPLSTGLNLEPVFLNTDNIKEEPGDDYYETMEEEVDLDFNHFELPVPPEEIKTESTSSRRRGRKSAQLASARLTQTLKKEKRPKEPKKESQATLLYRQIQREKYAKKWEGQKPVRKKKWEGRTRVKEVHVRRQFTCDECGVSLKNTGSYALEQHLKTHEDESCEKGPQKNYECPDCKIPFKQYQYFELHLSYHSQISKKCDICSQNVPLAELETHLKTHQDKNFGCSYCSMWYSTFESLVEHYSAHGQVPTTCELCPTENAPKFSVLADLRRHLSECHGKDQLEFKCSFEHCPEVFYSKSSLDNHVNIHLRVHVCSVCDKTFGSASTLESHIRHAHPDKVKVWYWCDVHSCPTKFPTQAALLRHQMLEHDKPKLKCQLCPKEFLSKDTLKTHVRYEHKVGKALPEHICRHCGKVLRSKNTWVQHEAGHTREKNFTCEICGFATHAKQWLQRHMEIHDEKRERKFQCPHCSDRFYESDSLVNHIRRHTGERPYQCDECGATFTQKSALNTHSKRHEDGKQFVPRGPRSNWKKTKKGKSEEEPGSLLLVQNCEAGMTDLLPPPPPPQEEYQLPADTPPPPPVVAASSSSSVHDMHNSNSIQEDPLSLSCESLHIIPDRNFL